ncbi:MAG: glycosyltransferase family 2 protein [Deferribacteraceae bacterium]|jgi:glycosyltransferase involved in cell wall biosynthesis|nr:glycosyltransferase family 2 protein [Deferribacteraceae bacterium]
MKKITAMVPAYNEEECLYPLYDTLSPILEGLKYDYEILFINDGSTDRTLEIIKELRQRNSKVSYINLSRNFGKETAMAAGFDYATGDAVVILDADLQDPPELIPEMVALWEKGYDDVYAKRRSRQGETFLKKFTSATFYNLLQKMTRVQIQKDTGDFRLLSRRALNAMRQYRETRRYTKGIFSLIGYRKVEILFDRNPRLAGTTKWNYLKLADLAIEGITSFTSSPLRISTMAGVGVAFLGILYMLYIVLKRLIIGDPVSGFPSLIAIITILGGMQLLSLGIIGEYLARVFDETKRRPLYFVDEYNDKDVE